MRSGTVSEEFHRQLHLRVQIPTPLAARTAVLSRCLSPGGICATSWSLRHDRERLSLVIQVIEVMHHKLDRLRIVTCCVCVGGLEVDSAVLTLTEAVAEDGLKVQRLSADDGSVDLEGVRAAGDGEISEVLAAEEAVTLSAEW